VPAERPVVEVVGLGPAGPDLVTAGVSAVLAGGAPTFVRTTRHPAASVLPAGTASFDDVYESADSIDEVYPAIVEVLVDAASEHGRVVYAVPGSPVVAEHTVELLVADERVEALLHPALSFLDLTWVRLGVDPVAQGVRLVDGHRFEVEAAGEHGPLLVGQCDSRWVLSDIKVAVDDVPDEPVVVLQRLGLPDERIVEVAWEDLDRTVEPDHLTSLWIPRLAPPVSSEVARFEALMRELRVADPWKADQTHDSLKRFLLEESYEVLEAIDAYDPDTGEGAEELTSELGDLLYQVVFHAALGAEAGWFDLSDVARAIHDKLVRRNDDLVRATEGRPEEAGVDGAISVWEATKRAEQGRESAFDGIPHALPALTRAMKVQRKAEALGLDKAVEAFGLGPAVEAEVLVGLARAVGDDPSDVERVGMLLAAVVDVARRAGVDPEDALRRRIDADEARYRAVEHGA
jgi:tetrapyrrole methylase family protein/MazG family protein